MRIGIDEALVRVAERTVENTQVIQENLRQRRNQVTDLYGVEFTRQGDGNNPASFYISISPDLVYLERFEFKLIIQPFLSTAGSSTGATSLNIVDGGGGGNTLVVTQNGTYSLSGYDNIFVNTDGNDEVPLMSLPNGGSTNYSISPDPHSHSIVAGITSVPTTASDFTVSVEGIDVTPYLMAQHNGQWISGSGVYPSLAIDDVYDILEVAGDLIDEGRESDAHQLTKPGYKPVVISSAQPFQVTLVLYAKYSHLNR